MDAIFNFVAQHAHIAHWVVFCLLMLAGLNVPISEDLVILSSGVLASTVVPENTWKIFIAIFLGAFLSDCFVYFIGHKYGERLWNIRWFSRMIKKEKLESVKNYYKKFGMLTLIIGRFIPFGVRNGLFLTAGIGKMHPGKFVCADGVACLLSNTTLFSLAYFFGKNSSCLLTHFNYVKISIFCGFIIAIVAFFWYKRAKSSIQSKDKR